MNSLRLNATVITALSLLVHINALPCAAQDTFTPIFTGTNLQGWKAERVKGEAREGILKLKKGWGWLRTEKPVPNFVLRLDVRLIGPGAEAGVFVRAWPVFNKSGIPANGYRVLLTDDQTKGGIIGHGVGGRVRLDPESAILVTAEPAAWHRYEIECLDNALKVTVDGSRVAAAVDIENGQGYVALRVERGMAEFKNPELKMLPTAERARPEGVFLISEGGEPPRLLKKVDPKYTREAMANRIEGTVALSAIVTPDGTLEDPVVEQSLDRRFGLDKEAVEVVRQWLFVPGTRDGMPVRVLVTIELTFTLK